MSKKRGYLSRTARNIVVATVAVAGTTVGASNAWSAEDGKSVYLLGSNAQLSGVAPPPGTYFSSLNYFYSGSGKGAAADSVLLEEVGNIDLKAKLKVDSEAFITIPTFLWVPQTQVFGGTAGFGILAPIGWQDVNARIDATAKLTLPDGTTYKAGQTFKESGETTNFGDPLLTAFIGWNTGNWHTKVTGLLNIPIGAYNKNDLANMGFNRWAFDTTGAVTWLDPMIGLEASVAAGFTFNGNNPATHYRTGTEFHVEYALMQHFSQAFSAGIAGYYYDQISGDSGKGATLGPFEGRVAAIGPNLTYNFMAGGLPVSTSLRWFHEFDATNRLRGDSIFGTLTIPLGPPG